ncbi:DUF305 domain-containing protein [Nocardia seriolae]|nr:DUF305 domain-containing protein [Nocardia seriolae]QOW37774.1 DUF305 domain-containing protein [Nocardia seriolae]QUN21472.1 DUF305 domain-containing protein [Nocardia seriolae]WKY56035.1 DUF305 domain-containing protein [Nocardia seriolae]WNJ62785.1 DUF305 domain-containing protein [Nocardia seriolae]
MFGTRTKLALIAVTSATALLAAGCSNNDGGNSAASRTSTTSVASMPGMDHGNMPGMGGTSTSTQAARSDFNDADVTFLDMMYPHHAQAVEMAKLVPSRSQNQQLITLAKAVEQAQSPEMQQITTLLASFGKPAPSTQMGHDMPGMMSMDQMTKLQGMSGAEFDKLWMQMMIQHHQGAITMANTELAQGSNADAKALAQSIVTAQQQEIAQMNTMLGQD